MYIYTYVYIFFTIYIQKRYPSNMIRPLYYHFIYAPPTVENLQQSGVQLLERLAPLGHHLCLIKDSPETPLTITLLFY